MSSDDAKHTSKYPWPTTEDALNQARMEWFEWVWKGIQERRIGNKHEALANWEMAKHRFFGTGPYAKNGLYDNVLPGWDDYELDHRQVDWRRRTMPRSAPTITVHIIPIADAVTDP